MREIELSPKGSECCEEMGEDHSTGRESMELTLLMCHQANALRVLPCVTPCGGVGGGSRPFPGTKTLSNITLNPSLKKRLFFDRAVRRLFFSGMTGEMAVAPPVGKVDDQSDQ